MQTTYIFKKCALFRFDLKFGSDAVSLKNKRQSRDDLRVSSIIGGSFYFAFFLDTSTKTHQPDLLPAIDQNDYIFVPAPPRLTDNSGTP